MVPRAGEVFRLLRSWIRIRISLPGVDASGISAEGPEEFSIESTPPLLPSSEGLDSYISSFLLPSLSHSSTSLSNMSNLPQVEKSQQLSESPLETSGSRSDRRMSTTSSKQSTQNGDVRETQPRKEGDAVKANEGKPGPDLTYILKGKKLAVVFVAMLLSLLLIALESVA